MGMIQRDFDRLIASLKLEYELGLLDSTISTLTNCELTSAGDLADYLESDISYSVN